MPGTIPTDFWEDSFPLPDREPRRPSLPPTLKPPPEVHAPDSETSLSRRPFPMSFPWPKGTESISSGAGWRTSPTISSTTAIAWWRTCRLTRSGSPVFFPAPPTSSGFTVRTESAFRKTASSCVSTPGVVSARPRSEKILQERERMMGPRRRRIRAWVRSRLRVASTRWNPYSSFMASYSARTRDWKSV